MSRILIYDLETSPNLAYVWGKYQQDAISFRQEWYILTVAYKWLGEKKTHVVGLDDFSLYKKDSTNDLELVKLLHKLFDEADIVVAHNGNSFDQKKSQARMIYHDLPPPSPYHQIDTKLLAKRSFNFTSNKLDDLGEYLKLGRKISTNFSLWLGCMSGDPKSWSKMKRYNKQDVILLEKVYLKLRPWGNSHPPVNTIDSEVGTCPRCGKGPLIRRGSQFNKTNVYQRFRCSSCNGWSRGRVAEKTDKVTYVN